MSKVYGASSAHVHVRQPVQKTKVQVKAKTNVKPVLPLAVKEAVAPPTVESPNVKKSESK